MVLGDLLDPVVRCFTPEVASRIAALQPAADIQQRVDELAEKASLGSLTDAERAEYSEYIDAADIVGILQAKARAVIANPPR
jgi:hypothetical protein